ncbi:MAG: L,D-transpeptidase family protein [Erythrobacter sp.]|nr:L,D-transpeptidase family protein [Erythrobacter sp.]
MKRLVVVAGMALGLLAAPAGAVDGVHWSSSDLATLDRWVDAAPLDALPRPSTDALQAARDGTDRAMVDEAADALALRLARMQLLGAASAAQRSGWNIDDSDEALPLEVVLAAALATDTLDRFFAQLRPTHPDYAALRAAYGTETGAARRRTIGRNMERWRWMPRELGQDYVLVNAARFEAYLWRQGSLDSTWRVIVGRQRTPTPVFQAQIEGVVLNPWWEVPASIVRESVGALVRNSPAAARARGYVVENGRYRQRPGPNNALGQMKLVMPNPYSVYMHDTPNRNLFDEEVRSFSHGCIRTGDAIGFATTLLEGVASREEVDAILASGQTRTLAVAHPMPVYITYFTAVSDGAGGVAVLDDIYGRDGRIAVATEDTGRTFMQALATAPQDDAELAQAIEC